MASKSVPIALLCLSLVAQGCGLIQIPCRVDAVGSVHGVRVVDAETDRDLVGARAAFQNVGLPTDYRFRRIGPIFIPSPDLAILARTGAEEKLSARLTRRTDGVFEVPPHRNWGALRLFRPGRTVARRRANIAVSAPGYHRAMLTYDPLTPLEPGWSDILAVPPNFAATDIHDHRDWQDKARIEIVRCQFQGNGVLCFYLRRVEPEIAAHPSFFSGGERDSTNLNRSPGEWPDYPTF